MLGAIKIPLKGQQVLVDRIYQSQKIMSRCNINFVYTPAKVLFFSNSAN